MRLGDRVVDVDRREAELAFLVHLVEPLDARGRLLGDALDRRLAARVERRVGGELRLDRREERVLLLVGRVRRGTTGRARPACRGGRAASRRRRRRGSCSACRRRPATRRCGACRPSTRRASRPSSRTPACRAPRSPRRRGPASSRCCRTPSGRRRRAPAASRSARRSGSSCAASRRCGRRAAAAAGANSSRIAIRPGISVSAIAISLRPQSASDRSATAKSASFFASVGAFIGRNSSSSTAAGTSRMRPGSRDRSRLTSAVRKERAPSLVRRPGDPARIAALLGAKDADCTGILARVHPAGLDTFAAPAKSALASTHSRW